MPPLLLPQTDLLPTDFALCLIIRFPSALTVASKGTLNDLKLSGQIKPNAQLHWHRILGPQAWVHGAELPISCSQVWFHELMKHKGTSMQMMEQWDVTPRNLAALSWSVVAALLSSDSKSSAKRIAMLKSLSAWEGIGGTRTVRSPLTRLMLVQNPEPATCADDLAASNQASIPSHRDHDVVRACVRIHVSRKGSVSPMYK